MDAFYASVEARDDPALRGVPLVVGADPEGGKGRGVVCTASYEARAFGVRSAMPISQAYRLAPHATFVPPDFERYAAASDAVMQVLERYADVLEVVGMDEAYLDVTTRCLGDAAMAPSLAASLQAAVRRETGLSCSVGIASAKGVAKVATDCRKPHGITLVPPGEEAAFLGPKPVSVLHGCGPRTTRQLEEDGFRTVADLAAAPPSSVQRLLGSHGAWLQALAQGRDDRPVAADRGPRKSRANETTFRHDETDPRAIMAALEDLLGEMLDRHGRRDGRAFATIGVKVRHSGFATWTRSATAAVPYELEVPGCRERALHDALELARPLIAGQPIRLVGVRIAGFRAPTGQRALSGYGLDCAPAARPQRPRRERPRGAFDPGGLRWQVLPGLAPSVAPPRPS